AEKIVIPDTVKVIDKMAFTDCSKLKEIVIPEGVEIIGDEVFAGCSSLRHHLAVCPCQLGQKSRVLAFARSGINTTCTLRHLLPNPCM
ncbi:MAG: leucine-rich repeat protein, partial [Peptococcaceae bacterium]|nr:leucine-rich repeat protein [Peptococcaceae bacterium]